MKVLAFLGLCLFSVCSIPLLRATDLSKDFQLAKRTDGCSDSACTCHPDTACSTGYPANFTCLPYGCYGPVIASTFTIYLPMDVVKGVIPPELEPVPNTLVDGKVPIVMQFAQQHNVAGYNYLEFIMIAPFLQWNDANKDKYAFRGPYGWPIQLFLDDQTMVNSGRKYGINKDIASVKQVCTDQGECIYEIVDSKTGEKIMTAQWKPQSGYKKARDIPNFVEADLPGYNLGTSIGKYPWDTGVFQCYITEWYMDDALVQPITGTFTIHKSWLGDIPTGTYPFDKSIADDTAGAYRMETIWKFSVQPSPDQETCSTFKP